MLVSLVSCGPNRSYEAVGFSVQLITNCLYYNFSILIIFATDINLGSLLIKLSGTNLNELEVSWYLN